jgi:dCMP deaminase
MKEKFIRLYMDWAKRVSELSYARRLQVGAVIVKDDSVISYGYNGMPSGWDNHCEDTEYTYDERDTVNGDWTYNNDAKQWSKLKTKPEVLHAESNAISKLAKSNNSGIGSTMFLTHSPCMECAKLIYQSGIDTVYYDASYRSTDGIEFLKKSGVNVVQSST